MGSSHMHSSDQLTAVKGGKVGGVRIWERGKRTLKMIMTEKIMTGKR